MDRSGKIKKHQETWFKNDCIKCACVNGGVNCTRYQVNVTYGLFEVKTYPISSAVGIPLKMIHLKIVKVKKVTIMRKRLDKQLKGNP